MEKTNQDQLSGEITNISHRSTEDWCAFGVENESGTHSVTGTLPKMADIGTTVLCKGTWMHHPTWGKQFKANSCIPEKPDTDSEAGVYALLIRLPGIGPAKAQAAIDTHGYTQAWTLAKGAPEAIGVSEALVDRARELAESFEQDYEALVFLLGAGLTPHEAGQIIKKYGEKAISVMTANPYVIIKDINGFGFRKADKMALKLGMLPGSEARILACIMFVLEDDSVNKGHIWINGKRLVSVVQQTLEETAKDQRVRIVDMPDFGEVRKCVYALGESGEVVIEGQRVFPKGLYRAEMEIVEAIQ